jgi:hypothetical protein
MPPVWFKSIREHLKDSPMGDIMLLYQHIYNQLSRWDYCMRQDRLEQMADAREELNHISDNILPSGSGIDSGSRIELEFHKETIKISTSFHHMDEMGGYDGWTYHLITVTPSLSGGVNLKISGHDRNDIKDYLLDIFYGVLSSEYMRGE